MTQEVKDAAPDAYRALIPLPGDPAITRIIAGGESKTVEFKSSARWDMKLGIASKEMEKVIVKTVATTGIQQPQQAPRTAA